MMVDSVPFAWLFPRVAAVVHHGGAGTTSAGLRAGVPSVVVPFFGDQPYWGQRVADLGVGPAPIPRKKLTAERLAQAIQTAVTDQAMRGRAAELGAKIRAEDGSRAPSPSWSRWYVDAADQRGLTRIVLVFLIREKSVQISGERGLSVSQET